MACGLTTASVAQDQPPLTGKTVRVRIVASGGPQRYFPEAAQKAHIEGEAVALCDISAEGALSDCVIQSESPRGYGFGDALVKTSQVFRIAPTTNDGASTAGRKFLLQMHFRLPQG